MKVVILAGGVGSRLSEETITKPKPMVEIGGIPMLWHIMKHYDFYGFKHFIIALGYKGEYIKKYMLDYSKLNSNLTIDFKSNRIESHESETLDWKVELIDTGISTFTGGRLKRLKNQIGNETFMMTWGDGISDIDLNKLLSFHKSHKKLATLTAVRPPARFGKFELDGDMITEFNEKPQTSEGWINGAFFVLEPGVFDYIEGDETPWDSYSLTKLAADGQLAAYKHDSFWACMDTLRDKAHLEKIWNSGDIPWKIER